MPNRLKNPDREAFRDLNRAITIQAENCAKKGYEPYFPTVYFSQYFHRAIEFTLKEKQTFATKHSKADEIRLAHTLAKQRITSYADQTEKAMRKCNDHHLTVEQLRGYYREFKQFLYSTKIEDKESYLQRFLQQVVAATKS